MIRTFQLHQKIQNSSNATKSHFQKKRHILSWNILVIADVGTLMPTWHVCNIVDNIGPFLLILVDLVFFIVLFYNSMKLYSVIHQTMLKDHVFITSINQFFYYLHCTYIYKLCKKFNVQCLTFVRFSVHYFCYGKINDPF